MVVALLGGALVSPSTASARQEATPGAQLATLEKQLSEDARGIASRLAAVSDDERFAAEINDLTIAPRVQTVLLLTYVLGILPDSRSERRQIVGRTLNYLVLSKERRELSVAYFRALRESSAQAKLVLGEVIAWTLRYADRLVLDPDLGVFRVGAKR